MDVNLNTALRDGLLESYSPRSVDGVGCVLCSEDGLPVSLHLLEASVPEDSTLPSSFTPMSQSRGLVRGVFAVCIKCAPPCSKCGIAIQTKKTRQAFDVMKATAPKGAMLFLGNGHCRHLNLLSRMRESRLQMDFVSPFARELGQPEVSASNFGLALEEPIYCRSIPESYIYLSRLKTADGQATKFERLGSFGCEAYPGPIDGYRILTQNGEQKEIFIWPYSEETSSKAPSGFILSAAKSSF